MRKVCAFIPLSSGDQENRQLRIHKPTASAAEDARVRVGKNRPTRPKIVGSSDTSDAFLSIAFWGFFAKP